MPGLSPGMDRFLTYAVRFVCGALIGCGIWMYRNWSDILSMSANEDWKTMLLHFLFWTVGIGVAVALTNPKDDRQWIE